MDKKNFELEKEYLETVSSEIDKLKSRDTRKIKQNEESIQSFKQYFADNYYDIRRGNSKEFVGEDEFANINITIENFEQQNSSLKHEISRLSKQKKNPNYGRFDLKYKYIF